MKIPFRTSLVITMVLLTFGSLLLACGSGKAACAVIDTAHEACSVIKYLGPDGKVQTVKVSSQELATFGQYTATMRAAKEAKAKAMGEAK
jgi:hypothetical protein